MRPRNPYEVRDREDLQQCVKDSKRVVPHSLRSLGDLAGVSRATIDDLLKGRTKRVTVTVAQRLSAALGRPLEDLFVPTASPSSDTDTMSDNGGTEHQTGAHSE